MNFTNQTIGGDITIVSTSTGRWQLCAPVVDSTAILNIMGDVIHLNGNFATTGTGNGNTTIVINHYGDIIATGGNFSISRGSQGGTGTTNWYMHNGNITMSNVTTQNSNPSGARFVFTGNTQDLTLTSMTYSGGGLPLRVDSDATVNLGTSVIQGSGAFTVSDFGGINTAQDSGFVKNLLNTGTTTLSTLGNYGYNGSIAQVTGSLLPAMINTFIVDNSAGVTLSSNVSANTLNLLEGKLNTGASNLLTVTGTSTASIIGGSETDYVNGPLALTLPGSVTAGSVYNYPIGKGSYKPLALVDPVTTVTGPVVILAEVFDENSGGTPGTGLTSLNTNRYWSAEVVSGATELVSTKIRLTEDGLTSTMGMGKSSTLTGTYDLISSTQPSGGTITSDDLTSLSFFVIGEASSTSTFALSVSVNNGWNMVSTPGLHPINQDVTTWWSGKDPAAGVFRFSSGYVPVTTTTPGQGYWMKHVGANTYNYPGIQIVAHDPIAGATGWNLIGGYELNVLTANITTTPGGLQTGSVFQYGSGYTVATNLVPGYGYWVKLTAPGSINIPNALAKGLAKNEVNTSDWGKIIITDKSGKSYTLYTVKGEVNLNDFELPPAPPTGMFDVRFGSGRYAEELSAVNQSIELNSLEYPVTVRVENADIRLQDGTGNGLNERLKSGEEVVISNSAINKLMVSGDVIPATYSLDQNYPNPFNPSTKIEFSIPEDVNNVTLTIYNALGQRVAELVNSKMEAGKYSYVWNASDVATGLYIYELRTDKFVSVKKMMLLK
jgi:hypothetical protein